MMLCMRKLHRNLEELARMLVSDAIRDHNNLHYRKLGVAEAVMA